jgi:ornithine carbamoyltransferase
MEHFLDMKLLQPDYLSAILDRGLRIKKNPKKFSMALTGKKLYMLFQKTSTRTALSFAFAMTGLGGEYFMQKWDDSNFTVGEIQDETRYVSRSVDVIMARLKNNADINLMASYATVPVINGCCDKYHPCQAMADLLTIKELFGHLQVKLLYIGVRNNVLNSLMGSLPRMGGELYAITPIVNAPSEDPELNRMASQTGKFHDVGSGNPSVSELKEIVQKMDVVYTDTWIDMEFINDKKYEKIKNERISTMLPFQINSNLMKNSRAKVMHDMPVHAGYEISRDLVEAHMNIILQQAENRKWAQAGILLTLLENQEIKNLFR